MHMLKLMLVSACTEHKHHDGSVLTVSIQKVHMFCTPGRLSYLYGLNGPSLAIDTACSSSLVAVGTARNALLLGVAGGAVAGGITLMLSPTTMAMYAVAGEIRLVDVWVLFLCWSVQPNRREGGLPLDITDSGHS